MSYRISLHLFLLIVILCLFSLYPSASAQAPHSPAKREEQFVTELQPVQGEWFVHKNLTINGRIFDIGGIITVQRVDGSEKKGAVVFANRDDYTNFEVWVGFRGGAGKGANEFVVLGDGMELYRSPKLRESDPAVRVSVTIKGIKGITLCAYATDDTFASNSAVWGEPKFTKGTNAKPVEGTANKTPNAPGDAGSKVLRLDPEKLKELGTELKTDLADDPEFSKSRPTLVIAAFKLISKPGEELAPANAESVREDLETALVKTRAFDVVERGQLDKVMKELKIGLGDTFDSATAQKLGKLISARTVLIGSLSDRGTYAMLNVRLIDTETGRVRIAASVELRQ